MTDDQNKEDYKNNPTYKAKESDFLLGIIDLHWVVQQHGFKFSGVSSTKAQPVYVRDAVAITVSMGTKVPYWIWGDVNEKGKGGTVIKFLMMVMNVSKGSAFDEMKRIALKDYKTEYDLFDQNYLSGNLGTIQVSSDHKKEYSHLKRFDFEAFQREQAYLTFKERFTFEPGTNFDFFLNRRITQETLDMPAFKGRFGNATGALGYTESEEAASRRAKRESKYVFKHHIIVPFTDWEGRLVGLEAKNRYTEKAHLAAVNSEVDKGGNPRRVRINPSKFYPKSTKAMGVWVSNIPLQPKAIHLTEQAADAMAYYQLNKDDPLMQETIFVSMGGALGDGQLAALFSLLYKHETIRQVITGFDRELSGLYYTLTALQNLPFTARDEQEYDIVFRSTARYEMEIDFILRQELLTIKPDDLFVLQKKIKANIQEEYRFEGEVNFFPALTLKEVITTVSIPFTGENANEIVRLAMQLLKVQPDVFHVRFPPNAKDWNDELMLSYSTADAQSVLLYDRPENRNVLFITENNKLLFHQRFTSFDHNIKDTVGTINPFAVKRFIKPAATIVRHEFVMKAIRQAQFDYTQLVPALKENFVRQSLRRGISFSPLNSEFTREGIVIARWKDQQLILNENNTLSDIHSKALLWMAVRLRAGEDPHLPQLHVDYNEVYFQKELLGKISPWFTFQESSRQVIDNLETGVALQLELLLEGLNRFRDRWQIYREKYTEPLQYYSSENLIFYENRVPLFKFDTETSGLELLAEPIKMLNRNFHPFFYKALQLFVENRGVFHNYMRGMRLDKAKEVIFYESPDHEIGLLIRDKGKAFYALYPNIPLSMRREMELLSGYTLASEELIKRLGISVEPSGVNATIKEKKISPIPLAYLRFYEGKQRTKFITLSAEQLKGRPAAIQAVYTQAYLWHLSNVGALTPNIVGEKERFLERNGVVYFNRIPVARYNPQTDRLDILTPPSQKFFSNLASFERNLVKNPAHRLYADYLFAVPAKAKAKPSVSNEQIDLVLKKIDRVKSTNELIIVDKSFKVRTIGRIEGSRLILDEVYKKYSDVFHEAMIYLAKESKYTLEWKNMEQERVAVTTQITSLDVPERKQIYEHALLTTPAGLIRSVAHLPTFENTLRIDESLEMEFVFLAGKDGTLQKTFGTKWADIEQNCFWLSKQREELTTLVLAQTPDQAVLYYQYSLPEALHKSDLYLSVLNGNLKNTKLLVERLLETHGINELRIVGEEQFVNAFSSAYPQRLELKVLPVPLLTVSQSIGRISKYISAFDAAPLLQHLMEGLEGHNFLNPAEGILLFPMRSDATRSMSVLGSQMLLSKDMDAMWLSRPLHESRRVILLPNVEEAIYYMAMNKEFVGKDCIIAFQNKVTPNQSKWLMQQLKVPRFMREGHMVVGNTGNLSEQLLANDFKIPIKIDNPAREISFRKEYEDQVARYEQVKRDIQLSRKLETEPRNNVVGKTVAPVLNETMKIQEPSIDLSSSQKKMIL